MRDILNQLKFETDCVDIRRRKYLSAITTSAVLSTTGCLGGGGAEITPETEPSTTYSCDLKKDIKPSSDISPPTLGESESDTSIDVFEDFSCPGCKRFHLNVLPEIKSDYIEADVDIRLRRFDLPLDIHQWAAPVANAARRVQDLKGDLAFFEYANWLYANQGKYNWETIGKTIEESPVDVSSCQVIVAGYQSTYSETIQQNIQRAVDMGVEQTPTVFVDGDMVESQPTYENISKKIESKI